MSLESVDAYLNVVLWLRSGSAFSFGWKDLWWLREVLVAERSQSDLAVITCFDGALMDKKWAQTVIKRAIFTNMQYRLAWV
jgi:hypothetical protein